LNLRPSGYEPDELPNCSTPRQQAVTIDNCVGIVNLLRRKILSRQPIPFIPVAAALPYCYNVRQQPRTGGDFGQAQCKRAMQPLVLQVSACLPPAGRDLAGQLSALSAPAFRCEDLPFRPARSVWRAKEVAPAPVLFPPEIPSEIHPSRFRYLESLFRRLRLTFYGARFSSGTVRTRGRGIRPRPGCTAVRHGY
jgi:hypothetical protein